MNIKRIKILCEQLEGYLKKYGNPNMKNQYVIVKNNEPLNFYN